MGQGRIQEKRAAPNPLPTINRELARSLSERVAGDHRLAFARSFAFAVIEAWWRAERLQGHLLEFPSTAERIALSGEASDAAHQFGAALTGMGPRTAAHLVGTVYTTALPETYRAAHGIFYTPPELVEHLLEMAETAGVDWRKARVLDPACGGGAFLLGAAVRMIAAMRGADSVFILQQLGTRLRGFDVDTFGAWLAQVMVQMSLKELVRTAGREAPPIVETRDSLDLRPADYGRYDLVVGNPPYGRVTLAPQRRSFFGRSVYGHANLYGVFTDGALRWVKQGGVIAYVTPTSMLSGLYYKALRALLAAEAPPAVINFVHERDGVFADVLQETMLAAYRKGGDADRGQVGFVTIEGTGKVRFRRAGTFDLPVQPEAPWLLPRTAKQARLARRLREMPHRLADYGYGVSTGPLVWNRFKEQFRQQPEAGCFPVIWAESVTSDGEFIWRSEKKNHAAWFAAHRPKDDWLIVDRPCVLLQRTTAKEQPRRLIAAELVESFIRRHKGVVVENHLNMVRAIERKPVVSAAVIATLLNSAAVDAAFRCLNGSVAVSAFEIEELPLPPPPVLGKLEKLVAQRRSRHAIEAIIAAAYARDDVAAAP